MRKSDGVRVHHKTLMKMPYNGYDPGFNDDSQGRSRIC